MNGGAQRRAAARAAADSLLAPLHGAALVGAVLALAGLVYLPTLRFGFVYDDAWTLVSNGFLRRPDLGLLFSPEAVTQHVPDAFRPTLVLFDVATFQTIGLVAFRHHALSVALHLLTCFAWDRLLVAFEAPRRVRLVCVGLFGLLAIHAEAVSVVSYREDLLAASLGLSAVLAVHRGRWVLGLVLCALACGAKLSAAPIAVFWLVLATQSPWSTPIPRRHAITGFVVLGVGAALALAVRIAVFGDLSPYGGAGNPRLLATRVGTAAVLARSAEIHVLYLQQMVLPTGLSPEYVESPASWRDLGPLLSALGLASLLGYGLWCGRGRRRPAVAVAILGAFALALPTSNVFAMPNIRADRFMYLPSVAVSLGLALGCLRLGEALWREHRPWMVFAPALTLAIVQGAVTIGASAPFASNATLWLHTAPRVPGSARAQALLGLHLLQQREGTDVEPRLAARVRAQCQNAERLDPIYELPQLCFARLAVQEKDWAEARRRFAAAVAVSPDRNGRTLAALAQVTRDDRTLSAEARERDSGAHLAQALADYPYSPDVHTAAARLFHRRGDPYMARWMLRRARSLRPDRWQTVAAGVELALDQGDVASAARTWRDHATLLGSADRITREHLRARLDRARSQWPPSTAERLFTPGVFSDAP